ncbi:MAG: hypothetical protein KU37_08220 [Sulfuricurvum sp. PC08-66]|nr:MAG: hypothetical protein KU37_08220 [Sulfuricurvum sp. PC08-66]
MKTYQLLLPLLLGASLEATTFEPIEVHSANDATQKVANITENVKIITSKAIQESRLTTLAQVLGQLGNVAFTSNGAVGQASSFYLRGMDSKHTLVLLDGVRINDVTGLNGAQFEHLPMHDIERIEIIKGAQSGIWGADAAAGVINIITKSASKGTHASFSQSYGSFDTHESKAMASYNEGIVSLKGSASSYSTNGISVAEAKYGDVLYGTRGYESNYTNDRYLNSAFGLDATLAFTPNDRLHASLKKVRAYSEYDSGAGSDGTNYANLDNTFYAVDARHTDAINDAKLSVNYSDFARDLGIGNDYTGSVLQLRGSEQLNYLPESFLIVGGDYQRHTHLESYGSDLNKTFTTKALYIANANRIGDTIASQNLRYDLFSNAQGVWTGKVGLKQYVGDWYASANWGTGYTVPTLYQLYTTWGGNANLVPEESVGYDVSIGSPWIEVTYYENQIRNLIVYTSAYENSAGISTFKGIEIAAHYALEKLLRIDADYALIDARNASGLFLARRPKQLGHINVTNTFGDAFSTMTQLEYVGERYEKVDETGAMTGNYALVNLTANYHAETYGAFVQLNNLFNTFYQTVDGYGTMGINFKVGIDAAF